MAHSTTLKFSTVALLISFIQWTSTPKTKFYSTLKPIIGEAGPVSQNTLAKFNANGNIKWIKQYDFTWVWGQMCSSSDGGAIISDIKEIIKVNEQGNVNWSKKFDNNFYSQNLFEIPGGYIFFRYKTSAQNASYATMLDYNGNAKWNSQLISNYLPSKGILRANGNLLFVGDYTIAAT